MVPFPCSLFMSEATNELLAGAYNQEISAVLFPLYTLDMEEGAGSLLWGHRLKSSCKELASALQDQRKEPALDIAAQTTNGRERGKTTERESECF